MPGDPYVEEMKLGPRFWLRLIGVMLAICVGGVLIFVLLGAAWVRWGALAALVLFGGGLLALGYFYDRRQKKDY